MRTRTRLTTPPGGAPADDFGGRTSQGEHYSRGPQIPTEPRVRRRYRRVVLVLLTVLILGALAYGGYRIATSGQYQDPSLSGTSGTTTEDGSGLPGEDVDD